VTGTGAADRELPGTLLAGGAAAPGPPAPSSARASGGDAWAPVLTSEMAARQRPRITQLAAALAGQMARHGEADLMDDFALPLAYTAVADLIGVSPQDRTRLFNWTQDWRLFRRAGGQDERRCAARTAVYDHMSGLLADRIENPRDDLSTQLATAFTGGTLPAHEAIATAAHLLLNGYPRPASFISGMLLGLLLDGHTRDLLGREPVLIPAAVEEYLRVISPTAESPAPLLVSRIDLRRPGAGHAASTSGRERCPGAALARLEAHASVTAMLPHLNVVTLALPVAQLVWSHARFGDPTALERCPVTWPQR
jgi:cytochrome P450